MRDEIEGKGGTKTEKNLPVSLGAIQETVVSWKPRVELEISKLKAVERQGKLRMRSDSPRQCRGC